MTGKPPDILARSGYRLRRAMDAARLLPVIGALLFFLPLLWAGGKTGQGGIYIFGIWLGLIIGAALLSRTLNETQTDTDEEPQDGSV